MIIDIRVVTFLFVPIQTGITVMFSVFIIYFNNIYVNLQESNKMSSIDIQYWMIGTVSFNL